MSLCLPRDFSSVVTYRQAITEIRSRAEIASPNAVHIYEFKISENELQAAYNLLDEEEHRGAMRVTYSNSHNFIVRYMPGSVHQAAHASWSIYTHQALRDLLPHPKPTAVPGCVFIAATEQTLGQRKKEPDSGIMPIGSNRPSIVIEIGSSESLTQLKIDAQLWLEHMPEVQLGILVLIDPPAAANPNPPVATIQLWRGFPPPERQTSGQAQTRIARMVWQKDWTHNASPLHLLLADIFQGQVPPEYGQHDRVQLDTVTWREAIHRGWQRHQ
ncbi:uncharacterized protein LACBIDRAFT_330473 [Laccaria bicolor S238N-H82]|uniref:Predicted protein n=1 Tax=Laccaria bicolor (strain S238N-H82 / ATCC MYA-4686) TaxID=486041 RepID=B0DLE5_LACBS|nr:uncharacterized protein LACBIDRAFT_330473 [Laccaria bicolor S238N-H82]EDR04553.1 predicted protein [Laccaria bicolor S238N-H82]|eukprot:XP_001884725.1 predicted protein [Laccaria bicolor S238N-H82]